MFRTGGNAELFVFYRLLVGYFLAYLSFLPSIHMFRQRRRKHGSESVPPESRLWWLLYGKLFSSRLRPDVCVCYRMKLLIMGTVIPLLPIGLFGFAWTSLGPPHVPWIAPMIFTAVIGIANVSSPRLNLQNILM